MADQEPVQDDPVRRGPKPTKQLPTIRIAMPKQVDMLRAYGASFAATSRAVTPSEVGALLLMKPDTVRLATPFFVDIGLLAKGETGHTPNADVIAFHRATEWQGENPAHKLRPTFKETWFAKALITKLSFRGSIEDSEALTILAEECGATPDYRNNLSVLLFFLESVGVVERDGSVLRPVRSTVGDPPPPPPPPPPLGNGVNPPPPPPPVVERGLTNEQMLLAVLDPDKMSDAEQDAVWTLLKYLKKKPTG